MQSGPQTCPGPKAWLDKLSGLQHLKYHGAGTLRPHCGGIRMLDVQKQENEEDLELVLQGRFKGYVTIWAPGVDWEMMHSVLISPLKPEGRLWQSAKCTLQLYRAEHINSKWPEMVQQAPKWDMVWRVRNGVQVVVLRREACCIGFAKHVRELSQHRCSSIASRAARCPASTTP